VECQAFEAVEWWQTRWEEYTLRRVYVYTVHSSSIHGL